MDLFTSQLVSAVGMTLVHFVWQGAAVGLIAAAILATCPRAVAGTRYAIAGASLLVMMSVPFVTFALLWPGAGTVAAVPEAFADAATVSGRVALGSGLPATLEPWLPAAVGLWALGVLVLTARLIVAWVRTERIRRRDLRPVGEGMATAAARLAASLGLRRPVALFESRWVDVPTVIGWLRPTILLPVGSLTGLSVQQLEAVLAHELAHIRRHDYLVNALQNLAETIFFYHPAVWWLSARIRVEREHCCDDVAVEACGSPVVYVRALALLEESRQRQAAFALAATDGSLVGRVRRLVDPKRDDRREPSLPIAACVGVILGVLMIGGARAQDQVPGAGPQAIVGRSPAPVRVQESVGAPAIATVDSQQAPPPVPDKPLRIGGDIRPPRKMRNVNPIYPGAAREAGVQGIVILEATIDPAGLPVDIRVLRSIPELDQAAINAVRQWRYEPTLLNGQPVAVLMTVTVNFTLGDQSEEALETRVEELGRQVESLRVTAETGNSELERLQRELELVRRRLEALRTAEARRSTAAAAPASPPTGGPLRIGGPIAEPRKIRDVRPVYPETARAAKVGGVVIMSVTIDERGNVTDVVVLRSIPMLEQAAIDAVRQWKYTPTLLNGVPTPVQMTVTVNFTLD